MKNLFTIVTGILAMMLINSGCTTYHRTGYSGYYDSNYGYYHSYGDGQPNSDYYYEYNQRQVPNIGYQQPAGQVSVGFNDFYIQLSPYGTWMNLAPYGQVWVANVPNFQPYSTNGYWTYTTYGWTWVSNYSWGWAPFHYGRWGYNNRYGWYWVPGYVWAPAWVAWSSSVDMYGWAPLMPGMNYGVTLSINLFPSSYWTFMQGRYMGMNNIGNYYVNRSQNVTIIKNTTIINNYGSENNRRYTMGPSANDVQRYTGRNIQPIRVTNVSDNSRAGVSDNELRVYRPATRSANTSSDNRQTINSSDNNRAGSSGTRSQPAQQQTQPPVQQSTNRSDATQTRNTQPATRQDSGQRTYQQDPAQPKVTNSAAPQSSRQIQAAQNENRREQQQRSSTSERNNNNNNSQPRR